MPRAVVGLALTICRAAAAGPEPWSDPDPPAPKGVESRFPDQDSEWGIVASAEYRAQAMVVRQVAVASTTDRDLSWIEHRARLDATVDMHKFVRSTVSVDVLDSVIWGDNGVRGTTPEPDSGYKAYVQNPNVTRPCIGLLGKDPYVSQSYGYTLCPADPIFVRRFYGDVATPFGFFRVGRMPATYGTGVGMADGDGRPNRFGISYRGNSADSILYINKPIEASKPAAEADWSPDKGFAVLLGYNQSVTDQLHLFSDDAHGVMGLVRFAAPEYRYGKDLDLVLLYGYRWSNQYDTRSHTVVARAMSRFGELSAGADLVTVLGHSREASAGYAVITNDPIIDTPVRLFGGRVVVRYDRPRWTSYLELDYASGDSDPDPRTAFTQFTFAPDTNVGLLLFEHVVAFQTARAAAAGNALLRNLGAQAYPTDVLNTRGGFSNAMALFPQFDYRPVSNVLLRAGVLVAWAATSVIDPVASLSRKAGGMTAGYLVNYDGGAPGRFYGTELDGRFQWRWTDSFIFDLEGAILFPGNALWDEDHKAAPAQLLQGRTTFVF